MKKKSLHSLIALHVLLAGCATQITSKDSRFGFGAHAYDKPTGTIPGSSKEGRQPDPLDIHKKTHVLLEVDGGGIMGLTPAVALAQLESYLQANRKDFSHKRLGDLFSVCSGTSTGAIITGMLAAGLSAKEIQDFYTGEGVALFNSKGRYYFPAFPLFRPQFKREVFQDSLFHALSDAGLPKNLELGQMYHRPLLLITAFDLCSNRTFWFRTREMNDGRLRENQHVQLVDAISASALSAAWYFGSLPAHDVVWDYWQSNGDTQAVRGAVFNDGGQGTQNNTLGQTALQVVMRNWGNRISKDEQVVIISLGCGNSYPQNAYEKESRLSSSGQVLAFLGNEARPESTLLQWRAAVFMSDQNPNIKVFRFDYVPPAGSSAFSAAKAADYIAAGKALTERPDFQRLARDLCQTPLASTAPAPSPGASAVALPHKMPTHGL